MTRAAVEHLGTFFVVGVVEQYDGFIDVLRRTMDPGLEHPSLWEDAVAIRNNGRVPPASGTVVSAMVGRERPSLIRVTYIRGNVKT